MARDHAVIRLSIWGDEQFRALEPNSKLLYLALVSHPSLTYVGIADYRPARLAAITGLTVAEVLKAVSEMCSQSYTIVDEDTEEILVRSFIRNDELLKQPKMALAVATAYAGTASGLLRAVIANEIRRLFEEQPNLQAFTSNVTRSAAEMAKIIGQSTLPNPSVNPSGNPFGKGTQEEPGTLHSEGGNPSGLGFPPSPTPDPSSSETYVGTSPSVGGPGDEQRDKPAAPKRSKPARGTRIPDGWTPEARVIADLRHAYPHLADDWWRREHEKFFNHFSAQPGAKGLKLDWNLTFRNWIHTAVERIPATRGPSAHVGRVGSTTDDRVAQAQALKRGQPTTDPMQLALNAGGTDGMG